MTTPQDQIVIAGKAYPKDPDTIYLPDRQQLSENVHMLREQFYAPELQNQNQYAPELPTLKKV